MDEIRPTVQQPDARSVARRFKAPPLDWRFM